MAGKPQPQLDSNGNSAHQPMRAAAAIVTAGKPASWLARPLVRLLAWPTNTSLRLQAVKTAAGGCARTDGRTYPATFSR